MVSQVSHNQSINLSINDSMCPTDNSTDNGPTDDDNEVFVA